MWFSYFVSVYWLAFERLINTVYMQTITVETYPSPTQLVEYLWYNVIVSLQSMLSSNQYGDVRICSRQLVCFCLGPTPEMDLRHVNYIVSIIWRIPWRQCTSYCGLVLSHWSLGTWRPSTVRPCGRNGTVDQRGATHRLGPRFTIQFIWE